MLIKDASGYESRAHYVASLLAEGEAASKRYTRKLEIQPITDMAERLHQLVFLEHHLELVKRLSGSNRHPHWAECQGKDELIAPRYEMLSARERADGDLTTSLNNIRYDYVPKLGDKLLPALETLLAWRTEHPEIDPNPEEPFAPKLKALIEEAKAMDFFTKAQSLGAAAGAGRG